MVSVRANTGQMFVSYSGEGGGGEIMAITDGGPFLVLSVARVEVVRTRRSLMVVCV